MRNICLTIFISYTILLNIICLFVTVPPMIWIQNQLVGAAIGQHITLECQSEAFPKSINYWMKNDSIIIPSTCVYEGAACAIKYAFIVY